MLVSQDRQLTRTNRSGSLWPTATSPLPQARKSIMRVRHQRSFLCRFSFVLKWQLIRAINITQILHYYIRRLSSVPQPFERYHSAMTQKSVTNVIAVSSWPSHTGFLAGRTCVKVIQKPVDVLGLSPGTDQLPTSIMKAAIVWVKYS